jgi:hypothetical protein
MQDRLPVAGVAQPSTVDGERPRSDPVRCIRTASGSVTCWPPKLVNELVEAADDKQLTKTIARYGRVDLLCIDELCPTWNSTVAALNCCSRS